MTKHAILNEDGEVVNVILWQGAEWLPPRGHWVIQDDQCSIGDVYDLEKGVCIKRRNEQVSIDPKEAQ